MAKGTPSRTVSEGELKPPLRFIHLSDIHFNKKGLDYYDVDRHLRDQIDLDVQEEFRKVFHAADQVLVSGDIAFAGKKEEYDAARAWLKTLCGFSGCGEDQVLCVPGNHDVDRDVYNNSQTLRDYHDKLRVEDADKIDEQIAVYLRDTVARPVLFRPIEQYNDFVSLFRCKSDPDPLAWQKDLDLNDGSKLRIHGINSTLVSDPTDDHNKGKKLIVGRAQGIVKEQRGIAYLTMCHHPPDWLFDQDEVHKNLNNLVRIQLFGHKHWQRVERTENSLRIGAGAVHPSRKEKNWVPRYNWISVAVKKEKGQRFLDVTVYPRIYNSDLTKFIPDHASCNGATHRVVSLDLEPWEPPTASPLPTPMPKADLTKAEGAIMLDLDATSAARKLTYRFLDLPHIVRIEIAQELGFYTNDDEGLRDPELFERIFRRAAASRRLAEFWDKVESHHADGQNPTNPYSGR
jgi:calcineurin-like phosphoesterase family protein